MSTILKKKIFSTYQGDEFKERSLIELQKNSFEWFLKQGLRELFQEISPITDHTGEELELHFLDYSFDEPKYTEEQTKEKDQTYEASLRVKLELRDKKRKTKDVQEVYLGDFPMMTERGTFIINGVERVVISQIVRSPGVYFLMNIFRGRKFFGAKIIPNRGSWMEFETDPDGFLGVRIDRKRKAPVTQLFRVFGFQTREEMISAFSHIDTGVVKYIEATLAKDEAETAEDAYVEIHKRLRPGDLATAENAKSLIDAMFHRFDRYDLSRVGRFKFNQRLGLENSRVGLLEKEDLVKVVSEIIRLNNTPNAEPDDIDHLGNRRVRAVGELVQSRLRIGFARLRRGVQDRMSTLERDGLQPVQLVNYKVLSAVVRDFFSSSQLSQFMDQVNPLAELEHKRRMSAMGPGGLTRERAGFEVRDVHASYYGRICPIQTPEGANIGLVSYLASYARLNEHGFIEAPYYKVEKGVVTSEVHWLDAIADENFNIAQADVFRDENGKIIDREVPARVSGKVGTCLAEELHYIDVSPNQFTSIAASLIPFLEHNDANRALMGSNMQRQAVPSVLPEAPLVGTGREEKAARDSQQVILSDIAGVVTSSNANEIEVTGEGGEKRKYPLHKFVRSNQSTCLSQRPVVGVHDHVKKGDVLADGPATRDGVLALGQNLTVAFIPWRGANFEDAIILSERVAQTDRFTSIHIETFVCSVRDTKLGPEVTTPDIPNVSEDKLRNLDEEGIVRIGAEVRANDILVGKISPKGESELTSEERLLRAIFGEKARDVKDSSLTIPHGKKGRIIGVKIFSREKGDKLEPGIIKKIQIEVAQLRKIRAGDKLTGRYGNKGVISQVRPIEDMPYLEDGTPVDVILNPLGVPSRMNLGQILEIHIGFAAKHLGYRAIVPNFVGPSEEDIQKELEAAGLPSDGKVVLYDGIMGVAYPERVSVGVMYVMKLNHLVEDKIHMRSTGPYSLITQQPLGGKAQLGGQRFGEMEVWALEGYGAAHTLQEMLTIKSDDVLGRASAFESIIRGREIRKPNIPASFNVLVSELKSLALNVGYDDRESEEARDPLRGHDEESLPELSSEDFDMGDADEDSYAVLSDEELPKSRPEKDEGEEESD